MSATRLSIYNDALLLAGERALTSLTENVESRRLLDQVWNQNGVDHCLEEGQWHFAMRTIQLDYDPSIEPDFGYHRAFDKPSDWLLTSGLCSDEFFRVPLLRYTDEAGYWYSDLDTIYVRYVSNDASYGADLSKWPRSFAEFVSAHFATKIVLKVSNDEQRVAQVMKIRERMKKDAKNRAAMALPTSFAAQGNWTKARIRGASRSDGGGSSGNLIG